MAKTAHSDDEVIRAAGGLLWRDGEQGKELLVVHRDRYDDWSLPKGKQEAGEELMATALREVREETGYHVRIERFAGAVTYEVDGTPKVVSYWQMVPVGEPAAEPDDEVSTILWLPLDRAAEQLQYPLEKALVDTVRRREPAASRAPANLLDRLLSSYRRSSISYRRLRQEVARLREEQAYLQSLPVASPAADAGHGDWWVRAEMLLWKAERALANLDPESGWHYAHAARRYAIYGMAERKPALFRSRAHALLREAEEKLQGWRRESALSLLAGQGGETLRDQLSPAAVVQAAELLHGHYDNAYQRLDILRKRLRNLTLVMGLIWLVWIFLSGLGMEVAQPDGGTGGWRFWAAVSALGLMGALLSIFLSIRSASGNNRIPVELADNWVTVARLGLAALTAIMAVILLNSGLVGPGVDPARLTWVVALAAGFSERLVVRALTGVGESDN